MKDSDTETLVDTWSDLVILSSNQTTGDGDDVVLHSSAHTGALAAGATYDDTASVTLPLGLTGAFWLFVLADAGGEVGEFNNLNNLSTAIELAVSDPDHSDLTVSNVNAPATLIGGIESTITWQATNTGPSRTGNGTPGSTVDQWSDRLVASSNDVYGDADDREIGVVVHQGALDPSGGYGGSFTGIVPTGLSGDFYVFVEVNADGAVYEFDDQATNVAATTTTSEFISQP